MEPGSSLYDKLLTQCKSHDVDVKVDALSKLQAYFENGTLEISDPEALISVLKASLRTSNLHLTNATLSALPSILPSLICRPVGTLQSSSNLPPSSSTSSAVSSGLIDANALRLSLSAFLQTGGIIDRLGDKERAQVKAREALVLLGGYAFRFGGTNLNMSTKKGVEPPITIFERCLKEAGLGSKVWKVREQSILALVSIRRAHHLFPIRPYLSLLVDCLEDTDPHVRDCARQSVIELFSGPGVTDAARADLKNQMTKKGVRKTIADVVLSKLLAAGSGASTPVSQDAPENGDSSTGKKEYVPPSLALQAKRPRLPSQGTNPLSRSVSQSSTKEIPRPLSRAAMVETPPPPTPSSEGVEIQPVYIASSRDLENEFTSMQAAFEGKETEHNWATREQSIQRVRGMLKGDVHVRYPEQFLAGLKEGFIQWSLKTLASLRTTVAVNTCLLYFELSVALGTLLDPYCDVLLTNLLKMAGFTKKITAHQSQVTVDAIITNTSPQPRLIIPLLWQTLQEKTVQARAYVVGHLKHYIETHGHRSKGAIDASGTSDVLEKCLKKALADANPAVRETSRVMFWIFYDVWPDRGQVVLEGLDSVARKQLEKAAPNATAQVILPPTTPKVAKKSSVAAAIAASRAKAKAIATAPPTLRHQATSTSHTTVPRRSNSPSLSQSVPRPASPQRVQTSPPSPSRRAVSAFVPRTSSSTLASKSSHTRTLSGGTDFTERSASPSLSDSGARQRSPLANTASTSSIRKSLASGSPSLSSKSSPQSVPKIPLSGAAARNNAAGVSQSNVSARQSLFHIPSEDDSDLLVAQNIPIPEDSDLDEGRSINLMSFTSPWDSQPPPPNHKPASSSPGSENRLSRSISNALSSGSISDMLHDQQLPVVEDALRARAEQAESAAERLLELVEPEEELSNGKHTMPPSVSKATNGRTTPNSKLRPQPREVPMPVTPNNRASAIMRQAAMFVDSPVRGSQETSSLLEVLQNRKQETAWWIKRKELYTQSVRSRTKAPPSVGQELEDIVGALDRGDANVQMLKRLAMICMENAAPDSLSPSMSTGSNPSSPTPLNGSSVAKALHVDIWEKNNMFDRFFKSLMNYLQPDRDESELVYGLIVVWEVLDSLSSYLEGKETYLFSMLLRVRYCNKLDVLEGTNAIRDMITSKVDPVYGLTTMHASLKVFQAESPPDEASTEIKAATCAFGLMALGNFILRLPAEIAEEELPRMKVTLISCLNDKSSLIVRESAAACIIAAQLVLRDETHLFALLDGLADEKKNLLTYLFDKHGARGSSENPRTGIEKLEKEIRRLDTRTSTPQREVA
ncbi:hypothetical protein CPC08DRAFT_705806 [Agrocybe pediades]|nr:hypothetical protein CPC08DRAFT_705806 [Agrocybe pediades]